MASKITFQFDRWFKLYNACNSSSDESFKRPRESSTFSPRSLKPSVTLSQHIVPVKPSYRRSVVSFIHQFWDTQTKTTVLAAGEHRDPPCRWAGNFFQKMLKSYFNCEENTGMATAEHVPLRPIFIMFLHNISLDGSKIVFNQREEQQQRLPNKFHTCTFEYWALWQLMAAEEWEFTLDFTEQKHFSFSSFCRGVGNIHTCESAPLKSTKEVCNERRGMRRYL